VAIVTRNAKGPAIVTRNERGAKDQPEQTPGAKRMASTVEKLAWPAGPANEVDNETTLAPPLALRFWSQTSRLWRRQMAPRYKAIGTPGAAVGTAQIKAAGVAAMPPITDTRAESRRGR
jgi:hypothetical protein